MTIDWLSRSGVNASLLAKEEEVIMIGVVIEPAVYIEPLTYGSFFYWFRHILFVMVVTFPFVRWGYLWWVGGGRIRFRRNESGRIIGLQYSSPINLWTRPSGDRERSPMSGRLTQEQVMALPEMEYVHSKDLDDDYSPKRDTDIEGKANRTSMVDAEPLGEVRILVSRGSTDLEEDKTKTKDSETTSLDTPVTSTDTDEEQPAAASPVSRNFSSCTMCSICIDDFEVGERIRVLPRCGHAFHTECIMTWLTERQGCCPLCKINVLPPEGEEESIDNEVMDHEPLSNESHAVN